VLEATNAGLSRTDLDEILRAALGNPEPGVVEQLLAGAAPPASSTVPETAIVFLKR